MRKVSLQNNKEHKQGQTNVRKCTCKHSGKTLLKGEGYKIITDKGGYCFIDKAFKDDYLKETGTSTYKHGLTWSFLVEAKKDVIRNLADLGWLTVAYDTCMLESNTLNKLKAIKNVAIESLLVEIQTKGGAQKTLLFENVSYQEMRDNLIIETKRLKYIEENGFDKVVYTTFPDFNKIV